MCISSSLVSIEVEFFTNVVIDGILRPKEGYTTSNTFLRRKRRAYARTETEKRTLEGK